jgi:hypothetical protein
VLPLDPKKPFGTRTDTLIDCAPIGNITPLSKLPKPNTTHFKPNFHTAILSATDFISTYLRILNLSAFELPKTAVGKTQRAYTRAFQKQEETGLDFKTTTFTHVHTTYNYHGRHNEQTI